MALLANLREVVIGALRRSLTLNATVPGLVARYAGVKR
jgi:hypothetical protein